jgi:hypothetical protein
VKLANGEYIMDSKPIATRIEELYPSPSLHLDSPALKQVEEKCIPNIVGPLRGVWMHLVPATLLNDPSSEYFTRTREESLGKSLQEFAQHSGGEGAWIEALPGIKALGELLKKEGGPYVLGKTRKFVHSTCCESRVLMVG